MSVAFKQHKEKYLLSMTVEDAYTILRDENPAFPYKFTIFKKFCPPNVRIPRSSDCIQCICPKHTNVEHSCFECHHEKIDNTNLHVVRFPGITMLIKVIFLIFCEIQNDFNHVSQQLNQVQRQFENKDSFDLPCRLCRVYHNYCRICHTFFVL